MEVSKACLMRCAVSGQRPGSLIVLEKHELTWWGGGIAAPLCATFQQVQVRAK